MNRCFANDHICAVSGANWPFVNRFGLRYNRMAEFGIGFIFRN
jgi:hypothetical protein